MADSIHNAALIYSSHDAVLFKGLRTSELARALWDYASLFSWVSGLTYEALLFKPKASPPRVGGRGVIIYGKRRGFDGVCIGDRFMSGISSNELSYRRARKNYGSA